MFFSSSSANLESEYKEDFESSPGSSSNTVTLGGSAIAKEDAKDAGKLHGFMLSPIHTSDVQSSSVPESPSHLEQTSDGRPPKDSTDVDEGVIEPPSKPKVVANERSDGRLLKGRASKSLLLNEHVEPAAFKTPPPSSGILATQEPTLSSESGKSIVSPPLASLNDGGQAKKFSPLAPISSDGGVTLLTEAIHKVDSSTEKKEACVLKPLEADSTPTRFASDSQKPAMKTKVESSSSASAAVLSPPLSRHESAGLVHGSSNRTEGAPPKVIRMPPSSSSSPHLHQSGVDGDVADSLTAVTGVPDSVLSGVDDSDLAELQSALMKAGLPPISTTQQQKSQSSQVQPRDKTVGELSHTPTAQTVDTGEHEHPTEVSALADDFNIQELIRAITTEELATVGKEILESSPRGGASSGVLGATRTIRAEPLVRGGQKRNEAAVGEARKGRPNLKPKSGVSRQKPRLSDSRESLASKSDSSFKKQPIAARSAKPSGSGKGNGTVSIQATSKKSKLPQKSKSGSRKGVTAHNKPVQQSSIYPTEPSVKIQSSPSGVEAGSTSCFSVLSDSEEPVSTDEFTAREVSQLA